MCVRCLSMHRKNSPCSSVGSGLCWVIRLFPSWALAHEVQNTHQCWRGGEEAGPPLLVANHGPTWNSSSCFTRFWELIANICNTGYYSKMASISGFFSTSGCNSWQFNCCCMDAWVVSAKSGGSHSNCMNKNLDTRKTSSGLSQKVMVKYLPAQIHIADHRKWLGKKIRGLYWHKQRKISNNHDQTYQVCTSPRWQKAQPLCITGKSAWSTDIFSWKRRLWKE